MSEYLDSQGIAGTIDLTLKGGVSLQGIEWRLGGRYYSELDPTFKGTVAITVNYVASRNGPSTQLLLPSNASQAPQMPTPHFVR